MILLLAHGTDCIEWNGMVVHELAERVRNFLDARRARDLDNSHKNSNHAILANKQARMRNYLLKFKASYRLFVQVITNRETYAQSTALG